MQWAAVKIYLELINDPPHWNAVAPFSSRYSNKAMNGNSPKNVRFPWEILFWFILPQFGPLSLRSSSFIVGAWIICTLLMYFRRQQTSCWIFNFWARQWLVKLEQWYLRVFTSWLLQVVLEFLSPLMPIVKNWTPHLIHTLASIVIGCSTWILWRKKLYNTCFLILFVQRTYASGLWLQKL